MSFWLKQSTAVTIKLGPFVSNSDGYTPQTSLTISQADIRLTKNGGAFAQTNNAAGATHDENGYYGVPLDTTDTNTLGTLRVAVNESGALPVWQDFMVVPSNVWDSLFGSDKLQVDAVEINSSATNGNLLKLWLDGFETGTAQAGAAQSITLAAGASTNNLRNSAVKILSGTGAGQIRGIYTYNTGTKVAGIYPTWGTNPDNTSVYLIIPMMGEVSIEAVQRLEDQATGLGSLTFDYFSDGRLNANTTAISGDTTAADRLEAWLDSWVTGTSDSGTTSTMVDAARTEADTDYWKDSIIVFTSGNISGQARLITGFTPGTDTITFSPVTTQAVSTQTYVIIPFGRVDVGSLIGNLEIETGYDVVEVLRLIAAATAGKASGFPTANVIYRDLLDTKNRITAVVDTVGNRTGVTLDVT